MRAVIGIAVLLTFVVSPAATCCGKLAAISPKDRQILQKYPKEWEVPIPKGSKLAYMARQLEAEAEVLPERDLEDTSRLPPWFRVYMRKLHPDLPTSGPYQYPRTANRILQRLLDNPNNVEMPAEQPKN